MTMIEAERILTAPKFGDPIHIVALRFIRQVHDCLDLARRMGLRNIPVCAICAGVSEHP